MKQFTQEDILTRGWAHGVRRHFGGPSLFDRLPEELRLNAAGEQLGRGGREHHGNAGLAYPGIPLRFHHLEGDPL